MARYATGKKAVAISDRSGFKIKHKDLKTTWDGLRVEKEEWEPKHPQLTPAKNVFDATALFNPRPDNDPENVKFFVGYNYDPFLDKRARPSVGIAGIGGVGTVEARFVLQENATGLAGTGALGTFTIVCSITETGLAGTGALGTTIQPVPPATGIAATGAVGLTTHVINDVVVTVQSVSGANKYFIGGSQQAVVNMIEGNIYRFDQSDSSNSGHPLRLSTTSNGTHAGGSAYTTGVTVVGTPGTAGAYTEIIPVVGAPTLYYYCSVHSAMGGTANTLTNVSVVVTLSIAESGLAGVGAIGTVTNNSGITATGVAATGAIGSESVNVGGWGNMAWGDDTWGDG